MKKYKISIIIPTYNRSWCVENAIKSVIKQDYENWELFIIDDGSIDNTEEVIQKYLQNKKIKYLKKENSGQYSTVNYGIDNLISGDILFILDSDDELLGGILSDVVQEFNQNLDFVSIHYKAKFPEFIERKSELIDCENDYKIVDYSMLISGKSHRGDFPGFINLNKLGILRFEEKCSNGIPTILWYKLAKKGDSKYINAFGLFVDSSRKPGEEKDNLTSFSSIYKRAKGMIDGYDILISENREEALKIDANIVSKWYFEQFQWCIIDRQLKRGYIAWKNALKYGDCKKKIKIFIFGVLFFIPKFLLPLILKFYYKTK